MTIEVTQEDREAACSVVSSAAWKDIRAGLKDDRDIVQAFARHRQAAYEKGESDGRNGRAKWQKDEIQKFLS